MKDQDHVLIKERLYVTYMYWCKPSWIVYSFYITLLHPLEW